MAIENFLQEDLSVPNAQRPQRTATVMGITSNKVYLTLDSFALDIKLYKEDIEKQFDAEYSFGLAQARPALGDTPAITVGDEVRITTDYWHTQRRRFIFRIEAVAQ